VHVAMQCPLDKVAQVIGKRGSILRELKRLSDCEIVVDQSSSPHSSPAQSGGKRGPRTPPPPPAEGASPGPPQLIRIIGRPECVEKAVRLVNAVIESGPIVALGMETVVMDCPLDKVPLVIGTRGLTAKEMMRRTGCKIHVNEDAPEGSTMCSIELTGTQEQLEQAKTLIAHVLEFGTKALGKRFQRQRKDDGLAEGPPSSLPLSK
jgi:rRNA processing protein Krr1/Pno1